MRKFYLLAGIILGMFFTTPALAWGDSGHRTVCEIAWLNLTDTSKAEVLRLLGAHPVIPVRAPRNRDLGWACTYPDNVVQDGPGRRGDEHYVNYRRSLAVVAPSTGCGPVSRCVVKAIPRDFATLRSPSESDEARAEALIYLGHWFGDIHQPLHSSFKDDVGGNELRGRVGCPGKLHWVWDTCILEVRTYPGTEPSIDQVQAVAAEWNAAVTSLQRVSWRAGSPWRWSKDAYEVTRRPEVAYCVMGAGGCRYSAERLTWAPGQQRRSVPIDPEYMNRAMPIIQERITQAGIRLAHWLNRALDPNSGV